MNIPKQTIDVEVPRADGWAEIMTINEYETVEQIMKEFHETCKVFERFPFSRVMENDTQYDLICLEDWFYAAYKSVAGEVPRYLFSNTIRQHTKPDPPEYY